MSRVAVIKSRGVPINLQGEDLDGGTRNLIETVRGFVRQGLSVDIFSTLPQLNEPRIDKAEGVTLHYLPAGTFTKTAGFELDVERAQSFAHALVRYRPYCSEHFDFLHTHHWTSWAPELGSGPRPRRGHLHTPHLLAAEKLRSLGLPPHSAATDIEANILRTASRVIAVSNAEADAIEDIYGIDQRKISVIPNGVSPEFHANPLDSIRLADSLTSAPLKIVTVGRLVRQKGLDTLMHAIALTLSHGLDVHCTVVGGDYHSEPDYPASLASLARDLGITNKVVFRGQCSPTEVAKCLRAASVFVQPTRYESQGIAIMEAMATGLPVIVTRVPAVIEYVHEGINGYLVDPEDTAAIAAALIALVGEPVAAAAMGTANRRAMRSARWSRTCELTLACLGIDPIDHGAAPLLSNAEARC